jgi:hypothetical protein
MSWLEGQLVVDYAMRRHVAKKFMNLGSNGGLKNPRENAWSRNFD